MPLIPKNRAEAAAFQARTSGHMKVHPLTVAAVTPLTADSVAIAFDVPPSLRADFEFQAGQHLTIIHATNDGVVRRPYSICSGPGEELRIGVKMIAGGLFSEFVGKELRQGTVLQVGAPTGLFRFDPDPDRVRRLGLIAAGSGITPIIAIAAAALAESPDVEVALLYGNRDRGSTMFAAELEALEERHGDRLRLVHFLSRDGDAVGGSVRSGRLTSEVVADELDLDGVDDWYLCAPEELLDTLVADLEAAGVDTARIHRELFHTDADPFAVESVPDLTATVEMLVGEETAEFVLHSRGPTILDAGLDAGLDLPYSCKEGNCSTCRAKVLEGEVAMERNSALDQRQLDGGYVLSCQAHPTTERVRLESEPG